NPNTTYQIYTISLHDALPISQLQNQLVAVTDKMKMTQGEVSTARRQNSQIRDDYSKKLSSVHSEFADKLAGKANLDDVKSLGGEDRKSTRLNSSHGSISYAVF